MDSKFKKGKNNGGREERSFAVSEVLLTYCRPEISSLKHVAGSQQANGLFRGFYPPRRMDYKEFFYVAFLNNANRVLGVAKISEGGMTSTVVDVREVFQLALKINALAIILSHNHPSGSLKPSHADLQITRKLKAAGEVLDIQVLDHLILTSEGYFSLADEGVL